MRIVYDEAKRARTLSERGLDFSRCGDVFDGTEATREDKRFAYGEQRWMTVGHLDGRMVIIVWTERNGARRIISLRKANEREQAEFGGRTRETDVSG